MKFLISFLILLSFIFVGCSGYINDSVGPCEEDDKSYVDNSGKSATQGGIKKPDEPKDELKKEDPSEKEKPKQEPLVDNKNTDGVTVIVNVNNNNGTNNTIDQDQKGEVAGVVENPTKEPEKPVVVVKPEEPKEPEKPVVKPEENKPKEPEKPAEPEQFAKLCLKHSLSGNDHVVLIYFGPGKMPGYGYFQIDYPSGIIKAHQIDWYWNQVSLSEKNIGSLIFEVANSKGSREVCKMVFNPLKAGNGEIKVNPATVFFESQKAFDRRLSIGKDESIGIPFPSSVEVEVK